MCGATLAQVAPSGLVTWAAGWHRKGRSLDPGPDGTNEERGILIWTKPRRPMVSHDGRKLVMEFHRPVRQICRECAHLDTVY